MTYTNLCNWTVFHGDTVEMSASTFLEEFGEERAAGLRTMSLPPVGSALRGCGVHVAISVLPHSKGPGVLPCLPERPVSMLDHLHLGRLL